MNITENLREQIVETLSAHALITGVRDLRKHCNCGWVSEERQGLRAHRQHLADAVLAVLGEVTVTEEVPD